MRATDVPDNNWVWFRAITSAFLRSVGAPWSGQDIDHAIARTEDWYAGDGWYSDGGSRDGTGLRNFDYYSGWAMQYYPLWYCRISGGSPPTQNCSSATAAACAAISATPSTSSAPAASRCCRAAR